MNCLVINDLESLVSVLFPGQRPVEIIAPMSAVFGAEGAERHLTQNGPAICLAAVTPDAYSRMVCDIAKTLGLTDLSDQMFVSAMRQLLMVRVEANVQTIVASVQGLEPERQRPAGYAEGG